MKKILTLFLFILTVQSYAYVATRTEYDQDLAWDTRSASLDIYYDTTTKNGHSTSLLSSEKVENIFVDVLAEWSDISPYGIETYKTTSLPSLGSSRTIRFSDNSNYFGSGVLAVTTVSHSAATGKIYAADILINDSSTNPNLFTDSSSTSGGYYAYLGDVLSHEMGHFLGLGHSEVFGSTMTYSVFKGQKSIHSDDLSGLDFLYNGYLTDSSSNSVGTIHGKVVSNQQTPIFGAQVQVISYKTGKVVAGVLTDSSGIFIINLLPKEDSYFVYVLPPRGIENLPTYYASIQTKYCQGNSYAPSFFTKCGGNSKGRPQVFSLEEDLSLDIGTLTIRCDEGVNPMYLYAKAQQDNYTFHEASRYSEASDIGEAFVGYFSSDEISTGLLGNGDKLKIDLSDFEHPGDGTYSLNVKVITEDLGSAMGSYVDVYNYAENMVATYDMSYDTDNKVETLLDIDLSLSSTSSLNIFYLHLFPRALSTTEKTELFANAEVMTNKNSTYLVVTSLKKNGSVLGIKDSMPYEDNYYCTEGDAIVTARPNAVSSYSETKNSDDSGDNAPSCGTIDIDGGNNGPGSGMMSFVIGLIFGLISLLGIRKSDDFFV